MKRYHKNKATHLEMFLYKLRDAQGNVMANYETNQTNVSIGNSSPVYTLHELYMYGSQRLGILSVKKTIVNPPGPVRDDPPVNTTLYSTSGHKQYELYNHLGNVLSTVSDDAPNANHEATLISSNDYYPFGAPMKGRDYMNLTYNDGEYRYGFNGKEKDDEVKGAGNQQDYGMRIFDPRLGRFMSVDPKASSFPWQSPYAAFDNNPILKNDPTGESGEVTINKQSKTITVTSNLVMYGGAASTALAKSTAKDIQDKWNAAAGKVKIDGVEYKVQFSVTGSYNENLTAGDISKNTDIKNNYIRAEETVAGNISYMDDAGSNTGYYLLNNIKGDGSTTEAHEFGHGYGLEHPEDGDLRGEGQPGIMAARGTLVDAQYQYNAKAKAGEAGGTINPEKRKVTQGDINNLGLDKLKFDKSGKANLGKLTNKYHEKTK